MAQFCTKCGAPLSAGMMFCTGCGATQGGPSAPAPATPAVAGNIPAAAPPSPMPVAPVVSAPVAAAPKPSSGSPVMKIILIVVAIFIFITLLGAGACVYMIYRAKQRVNQIESSVRSTFPMSTGTREVHIQQTPSAPSTEAAAPVVDMGVPIYPGATAKQGGGGLSMGGLKIQQYLTDDSVDKVAAFYKDKLGAKAVFTESGGTASVQLAGSNGMISIAIAPNGDNGKTVLTITTMVKPGP